MRRPVTILLVALLAIASLAQEQPNPIFTLLPDDLLQLSIPTRHILPEDIIQESIQLSRFASPPAIAVRFTYTEPGAQKILAFDEAHDGQTVRLVIGTFKTRPYLGTIAYSERRWLF
jgi:hypothetical protein